MSADRYKKLVKDIAKNGLKNSEIKYVVHDEVPYVVHGSNRLNAARYLGITNKGSMGSEPLIMNL